MSAIPGVRLSEWAGLSGVELVTRIVIRDGVPSGEAWRWDGPSASWEALVPRPDATVTERVSEGEHMEGASAPEPVVDSMVLSLPDDTIDLAQDFRLAALLRTRMPDGRDYVDSIPAEPVTGAMAPIPSSAVPETTRFWPVAVTTSSAPTPGTMSSTAGAATMSSMASRVTT